MSLLDIAHLYIETLLIRLQLDLLLRLFITQRRQSIFKDRLDRLLIKISGDRHHDTVSGIHLIPIIHQPAPVDPRKTFRRSQNTSSQRISARYQFRDRVIHVIIRRIFHHLDLLTDDLSFPVHFLLIELRTSQHVEQNFCAFADVRRQRLDVIASRLLTGKRIEDSADLIYILRDLLRRSVFRTLEHHVLNKMRNTGNLVPLIRSAGSHPDAQCS